MTEYRFANSKDWPKVIDFIDLVFSQSARPHNFAELIPKVYGDGHDYSPIHAIALEDGEIRGCVAVLPVEMIIAGQKLRMGYLGSVSVHRLSRGAGHMKKLMRMQIEKAKADGLDLIMLGGQRQRYGYFGFSPVGGTYVYTVNQANVRHALKDVDASSIRFEPLEKGEGSEYAYALYQQQPVCGSRTAEGFAEIARTFHMHGYLVKHNDTNAGYLFATNDCGEIHELVLEESELIPAVLKAWMAVRGVRSLHVQAAPHDKALNRTLSAFAEGYSLGQDGYMHCLNYANTIRSWMTLKNSVSPLSEGALCLDIASEKLQINVTGAQVSVQATDEPAQLRLSSAEADLCWYPLPLELIFSTVRYSLRDPRQVFSGGARLYFSIVASLPSELF